MSRRKAIRVNFCGWTSTLSKDQNKPDVETYEELLKGLKPETRQLFLGPLAIRGYVDILGRFYRGKGESSS